MKCFTTSVINTRPKFTTNIDIFISFKMWLFIEIYFFRVFGLKRNSQAEKLSFSYLNSPFSQEPEIRRLPRSWSFTSAQCHLSLLHPVEESSWSSLSALQFAMITIGARNAERSSFLSNGQIWAWAACRPWRRFWKAYISQTICPICTRSSQSGRSIQ